MGRLRKLSDAQLAEATRLYNTGISQLAVARHFGVTQVTVGNWMRKQGVIREGKPKGPNHAFWKGGRRPTSGGYIQQTLVFPKDEAFLGMATSDGKVLRVLEHRLVMARFLGRPLRVAETVHHINGVKADNRIENLQLRQGRHGNGNVLACGDCGSLNIVGRPLADS